MTEDLLIFNANIRTIKPACPGASLVLLRDGCTGDLGSGAPPDAATSIDAGASHCCRTGGPVLHGSGRKRRLAPQPHRSAVWAQGVSRSIGIRIRRKNWAYSAVRESD